MALLCGRYEGFDERVHEHLADDEVSIGRYVLAGGELPAMVLADVVMRKLPGALGHADSAVEESFSQRAGGHARVPALHPPPATAAGTCRRCWSPATTSGSASGGSSRAASAGRRVRPATRSRYDSATARRPLGLRRFFHRIRAQRAMSTSSTASSAASCGGAPVVRAGRPRPRPFPGGRGHPPPHPGLRGRRDQAPGLGARETFTVRKQSFGVGVERTFPLHSPKIEKLEVAARGDVRRAKLYYLRGRVGKAARVAERRWGIDEDMISARGRAPRSRRRWTPRRRRPTRPRRRRARRRGRGSRLRPPRRRRPRRSRG